MTHHIVKSIYGTLFGASGALSLVLLTGAIGDIIEKYWYRNSWREFYTQRTIHRQILIPSLVGGIIGFSYGYTGKSIVNNFHILIQRIRENKK